MSDGVLDWFCQLLEVEKTVFDNFLNFWNLRKALKIEGKGNTFKAEGLVKHCHNSQFKIRGKGNEVLCGEGVDLSCFSLKIEGNHNKVIIGKRFRGKRVTLLLKGSGHLIEIGDDVYLAQSQVTMSLCNEAKNMQLKIGAATTVNSADFMFQEDHSSIVIGKDCMFASGISLWCSDTHTLLSDKGETLNVGKSIVIGDHVWLGMNVFVGKNSEIADNSVVGWGSVVTRKFKEKGIVIAGNPAVKVKENINWSRRRPTRD